MGRGVELVVAKGKLTGVALGPGDAGLDNLGHGEHAGADVEPGHRPRRPDPTDGLTGDHPGAARYVEHRVSGAHTGGVEHGLDPLSGQSIDVQPLIRLDRCAASFSTGRSRVTVQRYIDGTYAEVELSEAGGLDLETLKFHTRAYVIHPEPPL